MTILRMNASPIELRASSVGPEGGMDSPSFVAALDIPYELPDFCPYCQDDSRFLVRYELLDGRLAVCTHCGREKRVPFSRAVSEVA